MKRLIITLLLVVALALPAVAADECTFTKDEADVRGRHWIKVTADCTAAADGSVTTEEIPYDVRGHYLFFVETYDNGTNPTDNTDLYLRQGSSTGRDLLHGGGVDKIDSGATENTFQPLINGAESIVPVYGPLYQVVSNNSANGAEFVIIYNFIQ